MRHYLILFLFTAMALIIWPVLTFIATTKGYLHHDFAPPGDTDQFISAAKKMIHEHSPANIALALIQDGEIHTQYFHSNHQTLDANTLFQVASISKWVTAWGIMALVEQGKLDLDKPVNSYLTRWKLSASSYDNAAVTTRLLLSHTAGLDDGLGYGGSDLGTNTQTLEESLNSAQSSNGTYRKTKLGYEPGKQFKYSGGGYTVLQLLIEEISGLEFKEYMQQTIFKPLKMASTVYHYRDIPHHNIAQLYNTDGTSGTHKAFTAIAAASMYTSLADLSRFLIAHGSTHPEIHSGNRILKPATLQLMRQPHGKTFGANIWGLGMMLYVGTNDGDYIFGHGGNRKKPAINATARFNPATGDGIIVLENGTPLLATKLGAEWTFWQTGNQTIDITLFKIKFGIMKSIVVFGWIIIIIVSLLLTWLIKRKSNKHLNNTTPYIAT